MDLIFTQGQVAEAEGVGHHEDRAEGHGQGCQHGGELEAKGWIKETGGNWDADDVIDQGPEEVLLDHAQGGPGELDCGGHCLEAGGHEDDIG